MKSPNIIPNFFGIVIFLRLIAILEGDDYWPKDKLERQVKDFNNRRVILSFGDSIIVNQNSIPVFIYSYKSRVEELIEAEKEDKLVKFFNVVSNIIPVSVMVRKSALKEIGGFRNSKFYPFVDIPSWLALFAQGSVSYNNSVCGFYRKHPSSSWLNFINRSRSLGEGEAMEAFISFLKTKRLISNKNTSSLVVKMVTLVNEKRRNRLLRLAAHNLIFNSFFQYPTCLIYLCVRSFHNLFSKKGSKRIIIESPMS